MADKSWKDVLLGTGLPLEYSVRRVISTLGLTTGRELSYVRDNEHGQATEFSVDVSSSQIGMEETSHFWVDYLIECKYRRDGTQWIFVPDPEGADFDPTQREFFATLDQMTEQTFKWDTFRQLYGPLVFAAKGCEVFDKDRNSQSIERGIHQLQHAVSNDIREALEHHVHFLLGHPNPVWITVPMLVTTAQLWCLREGTTINDIRSAEDLGDIAVQHDSLLLHQSPSHLLARYTRRLLHDSFDEEDRELLDAGMRRGGMNGWGFFVDYCSSHWPSHFLVVTMNQFETRLKDLMAVFTAREAYAEHRRGADAREDARGSR